MWRTAETTILVSLQFIRNVWAIFIAATCLILSALSPAAADSVDLSGGSGFGLCYDPYTCVSGFQSPLLTVPPGEIYLFTLTLYSFEIETGPPDNLLVVATSELVVSDGPLEPFFLQIPLDSCTVGPGVDTCPPGGPNIPPPTIRSPSSGFAAIRN